MTTKKTTKASKANKTAPKGATKAQRAQWAQGSHVNNAAFSEHKPGLLALLYKTLYFAAPERGGAGVTKAELLALALADVSMWQGRYADEATAAAKMKVTISAQVPSQHKGERGYIVKTMTRPADGLTTYYIDAEASERYIAQLATAVDKGELIKGAPLAPNIVKRSRGDGLPWPITTPEGKKAGLKYRGAAPQE